MKPLKTTLLIIILGTIGFLLLVWSINSKHEGDGRTYLQAINQFEQKIKLRTDSIKGFPEGEFYAAYYQDVNAELESFYAKGDLGELGSESDAVYNDLARELFETYVFSFTEESFSVFDKTTVEPKDLKHIKSEVKKIKGNSRFLEIKRQNKSSVIIIDEITTNYDDIEKFIDGCERFRYSDYKEYAKYPIDKMKDWVQKTEELLQTNYIQKVRSFKESLITIPSSLFERHKSYLKNKVIRYGNDYEYYYAQHAYLNNVIEPLENQINDIDIAVYQLPDSVISTNDLKELLKDYAFKSVMFYILKDDDNSVRLPMLFGDELVSDYQELQVKNSLKTFYYNVNEGNLLKVLNSFSFPLSRYYLSYGLNKEELGELYKKSFENYHHYNEIEWNNLRCYETKDGEIVAMIMGSYSYSKTVWDDMEKVYFMDKLSLDSNFNIKSIYSVYQKYL